jgi:hypothetical protein
MERTPVLVDLDPASIDSLPCCGVKRADHEGRCHKNRWLRTQFKHGLRAKVLLAPDGRQCGYIEYLPGEFAWRGVDAPGYMFIHCVFTFYKQYQHRGLGAMMLQDCLDDAAAAGMHGVAVVARDQPWLAGPALFLANGYELVDVAPPDYQLFVKKLDPSAANPAFKTGWEERLKKYGRGLTIVTSHQCPHIAKFAGEIAQAAEQDYNLKPRIVQIRSYREAQNAPTPFAIFAILRDGRVLADHQISLTRFRNIMNAERR